MTMRDCATFDIHDVIGQAEFLSNGERDRREGLVDLDTLHVRELPSSALQRLADGRDRAETEHAGFDRRNPVGYQPGHRCDRSRFSKSTIRDDHRGRAAVEAGGVAGRYRSAFPEGRTELGEHFDRRVGPRCLVDGERLETLLAANLDCNDLVLELARLLGGAETLLRAFGEAVLCRTGELRTVDEILRVPARMLAREGIVE